MLAPHPARATAGVLLVLCVKRFHKVDDLFATLSPGFWDAKSSLITLRYRWKIALFYGVILSCTLTAILTLKSSAFQPIFSLTKDSSRG